MIRSFLAADVPTALRKSISDTTAQLRISLPQVKWVNPEGIHLTLKFLGNIEEAQIKPISQALDQVIVNQKPLILKAEGVGAFPNLKRPRVIWIGLTGDIERLTALHKEIEQSLSTLGFPAENRPFNAHLTLGRVRSGKTISSLDRKIQELKDITFTSFVVNQLVLYRSILHPQGAIYTPLQHFPLMG